VIDASLVDPSPGAGDSPMAARSNPSVLVLDLALRPYELLAAWRPDARRLGIVVNGPVQLGQRVQARVSVLGLGVAATILGRAVRADAAPLGAEIQIEPDELRLRALERLVEIAAGARVVYRNRAPRYLAEVPVLVYRDRHATRMRTFAVSEGGCGLAWAGPAPMPSVGTPLEVHLGAGAEVASFCGEVCWTAPSGRAPTLGLRFAAGDHITWARMLDQIQQSGAPPA
jgi:hypothetical protein